MKLRMFCSQSCAIARNHIFYIMFFFTFQKLEIGTNSSKRLKSWNFEMQLWQLKDFSPGLIFRPSSKASFIWSLLSGFSFRQTFFSGLFERLPFTGLFCQPFFYRLQLVSVVSPSFTGFSWSLLSALLLQALAGLCCQVSFYRLQLVSFVMLCFTGFSLSLLSCFVLQASACLFCHAYRLQLVSFVMLCFTGLSLSLLAGLLL